MVVWEDGDKGVHGVGLMQDPPVFRQKDRSMIGSH